MSEVATIDHGTNEPVEPVKAPEQSDSATILQIIERAAVNPEVDIDKMERLMKMHRDMADSAAVRAFNEAMAAAQAEMPQVVARAYNTQTKSKYARYESLSAAIQPVVTKHGFALSFGEGQTDKKDHLRIVCDVMHVGGHTKQYFADIPVDATGIKGMVNKTGTHAYGSTKSYGRRYLKLDIFDVAIKGDDDDGNSAGAGELISEEQAMQLRELIQEVGADEKRFLAYGQVERLEDIPTSQFQNAVAKLKTKAGSS